MPEKEYDYTRIAKGMELCGCGHQALMHSWWADEDLGLHIPMEYFQCNVTKCKCEKFKIDTLWLLEELAVAKAHDYV